MNVPNEDETADRAPWVRGVKAAVVVICVIPAIVLGVDAADGVTWGARTPGDVARA